MTHHEKAGQYLILRPDFPFDLKNTVKAKTFVGEALKEPNKGVLLDLSRVDTLDSMGHKMIQNLFLSLKRQNRGLIVYSERKEQIAELKQVSPDLSATTDEDEAFKSALHASASGAWLDITIECPICANHDFPAQVLDWANIGYYWNESHILPQGRDPSTGREINLYKSGIIVCPECLLTSFYHTDFVHHLGDKSVPPAFSLDSKNLLLKTTGRRLEMAGMVGEDPAVIGKFARDKERLETLYRLCAECNSTITFDRSLNRFFELGFAWLLVYCYMPEKKKDPGLLERADSAFKDCLRFPPEGAPSKVWQAQYFRTVLTVMMNKTHVSIAMIEAFRQEREAVKAQDRPAFDFWLNGSQAVHRKAINDIVIKAHLV